MYGDRVRIRPDLDTFVSAVLHPGRQTRDIVRSVPIVKEAGWAPGPVWTGIKIIRRVIMQYHHHHKHQGLGPLIRSVSRVTAALANVPLVFQLFSFPVIYSGMISKGFGFVTFFASVEASSVCIRLSCLIRL